VTYQQILADAAKPIARVTFVKRFQSTFELRAGRGTVESGDFQTQTSGLMRSSEGTIAMTASHGR
jgi:hypothetical protein